MITTSDWETLAAETAESLEETVGLAEYWKGEADTLADRVRRRNAVLEDAILALHEANVIAIVIAAGYHPFHAPGIELVETIRGSLRNGDLEGSDLTRELVWHLATVRGLEFETDLTPIL